MLVCPHDETEAISDLLLYCLDLGLAELRDGSAGRTNEVIMVRFDARQLIASTAISKTVRLSDTTRY